MKRRAHILVALVAVALLSGCATMTPTERGIGTGGLIGAGTGALIGKATGNAGAGALLGAGLGALTGGLIGNAVEESEARTEARLAAHAEPARGPLGLTDVAQMAQAQISDSVIISQIRATGSTFQLSPTDTIWLKQQGVSDAVIQEMLASACRPPRRIYTATPVYTRPIYIVEPCPPPPVVGIGFGYTYSRRCR